MGFRLNVPKGVEHHVRHDVYELTDVEHRTFTIDASWSPATFLQRCIGSKTQARCAAELIIWAQFLIDNPFQPWSITKDQEKAAGMAYLALGLQEGARSLEEASSEKVAAVAFVLASSFVSSESLAPTLYARDILRLLLNAWRALPSEPATLAAFQVKHTSWKWISAMLPDGASEEITVQDLSQIASFFEAAAEFHQKPVPQSDKLGDCLEATLVLEDMPSIVCAYGRHPGEQALRPVTDLLATDLVGATVALRFLVARGAITETDAEQRRSTLAAKVVRMERREYEWWYAELRKRGDHVLAAEKLQDLAAINASLGNFDAVEQNLLGKVVELELADNPAGVTEALVRLAIIYQLTEQWIKMRDVSARALALSESREVFAALDAYSKIHALHRASLEALGQRHPDRDMLEQRRREYGALDARLRKLVALSQSKEPQLVIGEAEALAKQSDPQSSFGTRMRSALLDMLIAVGELNRASLLVKEIRAPMARLFGRAAEIELLRTAVRIEQDRGNVGEFLKLLADLERLGRRSRGDNWAGSQESMVARGLIELEEYDRADQLLQDKRRRQVYEKLHKPRFRLVGDEDEGDLLLAARILMGRGNASRGMELVEALRVRAMRSTESESPADVLQKQRLKKLLDDIARIEAAAGHSEHALSALDSVLAELKPASNLGRWVELSIRAGQAALASNIDQSARVQQFEWIAPRIADFPELGPVNAARMYLFLGQYFRLVNSPNKAAGHLADAAEIAEALGAIDEQIAIHRERGQLAEARHDLPSAIDAYQKSVALLQVQSSSIDSHTSKIGYRSSRADAIPLLVAALLKQARSDNIDEVFTAVEAGKSRALTELLLRSDGQQRQARDPIDVNLAAVQQRLPSSSRVLEYYTLPQGILRLDITRSRASLARLELTAAAIDAEVAWLRKEATETTDEPMPEEFRKRAAALGRALLPVDLYEDTATEKTLYTIPSGALHLLPFSMLVDANQKFIDERSDMHIVYVPNAAFLLRPRSSLSRLPSSIAFVNPAREREKQDTLDENPGLRDGFKAAVTQWQLTQVRDAPMTRAEFLQQSNGIGHVFLYAHAQFRPENPMASYVELLDGELTAEDLLRQPRLGGGLWTLAACNTGGGKLRNGDEVLGLPRALLAAGAGSVVATLWDVDSSASLEAMTLFYRHLRAGEPVAKALHAARDKLRGDGRPPLDWAPFILIGHDDFAR